MGFFGKAGKGDDKSPEDVARTSDDAYCTECHTWYDSGDQAQVNRHAH